MSQGSRCAAERRSESPSAQTISIDMFLRSGVVMGEGARICFCAVFQVKSSQVNTRMLFKTTRISRTPNILVQCITHLVGGVEETRGVADSAPGFNTRGPAGGARWVGRGIIVSLRTVADRERRPLSVGYCVVVARAPPPPNLPKRELVYYLSLRSSTKSSQVKSR